MSEELSEDIVEQAEEIKPSGTFVVTDRMKAIARGENPDAIQPEVESDTEVDEEAEKTASVAVSDAPTSWITDSDRARAVSYGLDPEDLDAYESREQFGSVLRALDKASSRREPPAEKTASVAVSEEAEKPEYVDQLMVDGKVNLEYLHRHKDEIEGADFLIAQAQYTESLEKKIQEFDARQAEREQAQQQEQLRQFEAQFHREVDSFRPELFGKTTDATGQVRNLTAEEADRRYKLLDACAVYTSHLHSEQQRAGLPPSTPPLSEVLKHAEFIAFPQEARERAKREAIAEREAELKKIAKQSQRVRPVATTAGADAAYRGTPHENPGSTEAIMRHPNVRKVLERIYSTHH